MMWWSRYSALRMSFFAVVTAVQGAQAIDWWLSGDTSGLLVQIGITLFSTWMALLEWEKPRKEEGNAE